MRKQNIIFLSSVAAAWDMLLDFRPPKKLRDSSAAPDDYLTMLAMPLLGLLGGVALLLVWKLAELVFPLNGSAMIFAVVGVMLLEFKDSGRGLSLLCMSGTAVLRGVRLTPLLPQLTAVPPAELNGAFPIGLLVGLELLKLAGLFILARFGAAVWIIAVLMLGFTVQAYWCGMRNLRNGNFFLKVALPRQMHCWFLAAFIMLFVALRLPLPSLAGTAVAFFFALIGRNWCERLPGGATPEMLTLAGAATETAIILVGLLFLT